MAGSARWPPHATAMPGSIRTHACVCVTRSVVTAMMFTGAWALMNVGRSAFSSAARPWLATPAPLQNRVVVAKIRQCIAVCLGYSERSAVAPASGRVASILSSPVHPDALASWDGSPAAAGSRSLKGRLLGLRFPSAISITVGFGAGPLLPNRPWRAAARERQDAVQSGAALPARSPLGSALARRCEAPCERLASKFAGNPCQRSIA